MLILFNMRKPLPLKKAQMDAVYGYLIYPAVSGGDIVRFGYQINFYVLVTQDPVKRKGYDEDWLRTQLPLTYAYLVNFRDILISRASFQKYFHKEVKKDGKVIAREPIAPFYSMYNISKLSFSNYRVVWKRMDSKMVATVLSEKNVPFGRTKVICTDTTSFFALDKKLEAHYLCAILNTNIVDKYIKSFSAPGRGFGAPSVMETLGIPKFDEEDPLHNELAGLSINAHKCVAGDKGIENIEKEIENLVEKLWNIKS